MQIQPILKKRFALGLVLKVTIFGTQNWPIHLQHTRMATGHNCPLKIIHWFSFFKLKNNKRKCEDYVRILQRNSRLHWVSDLR